MTSTLFSQAPHAVANIGAFGGTAGLRFSVSQASTLGAIWLDSSSGITALPSTIALYDTAGSGTLIHSETASWSGSAGSGWIRAAFSSAPTLSTGVTYMAVIFATGAASYGYDTGFTWPVTVSPITGLDGGWYNLSGSLAYPNSQGGTDWNWYIDVEVTPSGVTSTGSVSMVGLMSASATGAEAISSTGSASLPRMTASGSGAEAISASGSAALARMSASGSSGAVVTASGSVSLATASAAGIGAEAVSGSGSASMASLRATGGSDGAGITDEAGNSIFDESGAGLTAEAGAVPPVSASGSAGLASMSAHGAAPSAVSASGSVSLAGLRPSGASMSGISDEGLAGITDEAGNPILPESGGDIGPVPVTSHGGVSLASLSSGGGAMSGTGTGALDLGSILDESGMPIFDESGDPVTDESSGTGGGGSTDPGTPGTWQILDESGLPIFDESGADVDDETASGTTGGGGGTGGGTPPTLLQPPVPNNWLAGDTLDADSLNTYVRDAFMYLSHVPLLRVRQSVAQTGIAPSTWTVVTLGQVDEDTYSGWGTWNIGNAYQAQAPGWYSIALTVSATVPSATPARVGLWYWSASAQVYVGPFEFGQNAAGSPWSCYDETYLGTGDLVLPVFYHQASTAQSTTTAVPSAFEVTWISS